MDVKLLVTELQGLSESKKALMLKLLELTKRQQDIILADDDMVGLEEVIDSKQRLMIQIDELDVYFLDKYTAVKAGLGIDSLDALREEPVAGFKALKEEIEGIVSIMQAIKQLDDINTQRAKDNLDKVKAQLKVINVGKKATNSYSNSKYKQSQSILIDNKR